MNFKRSCLLILFLGLAVAAYSHGTKYELVKSGRIGLKAMFDTGEPMSNADVLVFSPNATSPSIKEKADSNGIFYFTPDKAGTWVLQVRDKTGHGMRINLKIDESLSIQADSSAGGLNTVQKVVMALCVVWGAVGTALYFKGKKGQV
ncbi:MAG TPA: carboxypeptidase regulatory-like domain-containing protein [Spirochaetota bacterium]|nr:carboxypeptidase regulatory-like domain-containing protein [Spirochaetota bacterium]HPJ34411.1 carboxypeptidase regulatory-like domain-containing protein [Spirochaetota bacterium]